MENLHKGKSRYPGIRPFDINEQKLFFGREKEIKELYSLIRVKPFVVLFSKSGIGKTSLLNAGVLPKLETDKFRPIRIRFQSGNNTDLLSPTERLKQAVKKLAHRALLNETGKEKLKRMVKGRDALLWEELKSYDFQTSRGITPILILDQFEEFFYTDEHDKKNTLIQQQRKEFIDFLADLLFQRVPDQLLLEQQKKEVETEEEKSWYTPLKWKVVFAIRSDKLSLLDQLSNTIPVILDNRYQLHPLQQEQAKQAIIAPALLMGKGFASPQFDYEAATIQTIQRELSNKKGEIESFQLQIICQHIEQKIIQESQNSSKTSFVASLSYLGGKNRINTILNNYYENRIGAINDPIEREAAAILLERWLIKDDKRVGLYEDFILNNKDINVSSELLKQLVDNRLIRIEIFDDNKIYEIAHDTLVAPIAKSAKKRLEEEAIIQQRKRRKRIIIIGTVGFIIINTISILGIFLYMTSKNLDKTTGQLNETTNDLNISESALQEKRQELLGIRSDAQTSYTEMVESAEKLFVEGQLDLCKNILDRAVRTINIDSTIDISRSDSLLAKIPAQEERIRLFEELMSEVETNLNFTQNGRLRPKHLEAIKAISTFKKEQADLIPQLDIYRQRKLNDRQQDLEEDLARLFDEVFKDLEEVAFELEDAEILDNDLYDAMRKGLTTINQYIPYLNNKDRRYRDEEIDQTKDWKDLYD